jgi:hypothetical protein
VRRDVKYVTRRAVNKNVEGWRRGRFKKRWIDCMRQDIRKVDMSAEMTTVKGKWKEKRSHAAQTPDELGRQQEDEILEIRALHSPKCIV